MQTKELIEKFNIRANKSFGQNFLHRQDIIEQIADAARGTPICIEVGAGLGVLSRALCEKFEKVATIEIDRSLGAVTDYTLAKVQNHTLIYQNFLKTDIRRLKEELGNAALTVCGNLPYNITGDIIAKLLKNRDVIEKAVVMVQKEAAEKLAAGVGEDSYRAISVLTQYFCEIETVLDVSPECFIPAPHVTSRVIKLVFRKERIVPQDKEPDFYQFVQTVFSKRRKLLTASLQNSEQKEKAKAVLKTLGFSDKTRGEQLSPEQLAKFYVLMFCE